MGQINNAQNANLKTAFLYYGALSTDDIKNIVLALRCPELDAPSNGRMMGSDFTFGAMLNFSCNHGFSLEGSEVRKCGVDALWDGQTAECKSKHNGIQINFKDNLHLHQF